MERLEERIARAVLVYALGLNLRIGTRILTSAHQPAAGWRRSAEVGADFLLHRCTGRAFFSGLGAESARTPHEPGSSASNRLSGIWIVTLQQALGTFQLALRIIGEHRWDFLRTSLERRPPRTRLQHYSCQRRLDMGAVVLDRR